MSEQPKEYIITEAEITEHTKLCVRYASVDFDGMKIYDAKLNALEERIRSRPAPQQPDERDMKWRMWFVGDLVSALRWDAEHGNPSLFRAVDLAQRHLGEKIDKQPPTPAPPQPAQPFLDGREYEAMAALSVIQNTKERYEDDDNATVEDVLDDVRNHLEGSLIDIDERKKQPPAPGGERDE